MATRDSLEATMFSIDQFTSERDWGQFHTVKNIVTSISIESAELCETVQWSDPSTNDVKNDAKLLSDMADEVADVMTYCLRLCSLLDLDPIEIIHQKSKKNSKKYPVNVSKGSSLKYTAYENQ